MGGRRQTRTQSLSPQPQLRESAHACTHTHTRLYKNVHLHGWTLNPVKVQMFGSRVPRSPRVHDQRPWVSDGGDPGQKGKLGKVVWWDVHFCP